MAPIRQQRIQKGLKKCGKFLAFRYVKEGKTIQGKDYKGMTFSWKVGQQVSCESKNIIYLLECDKDNCKKQYVGLTHQELCECIYQNVGYVRNNI